MEIISRADARLQNLSRYFNGKPCKNGHLSERRTSTLTCIECECAYRASDYQRNKEARKQASADYRLKNAEAVKAADSARYVRDREKRLIGRRDYELRNKSARSAAHVALRRRRRATDPVFALKHNMRALIGSAFASGGFKKNTKTATILGCTWPEFVIHIERQFLPGMSWANRGEWHIDHIVALATAVTEADVIALNHFTNLRPLWIPDNLKKGAKQTHLL